MQRTLRQSRQSGVLNLSARDLKDIPEAVFYPTKCMESDENLWECRDLVKLDLSYNDLVTVPQDVEHLQALTWLKLKQNQLTDVPPQLGSLTSLVNLDLSNNKLTQAPAFLGLLVQLRELSLSANGLRSLPDDFQHLGQLEILSIHENELTHLPRSIENLAKLRELSAHQNALVSLPPLSSLVLLETLNLSKNKLTEVPSLEPLSRLKSLDLRQNRLNIMPLLPSPSVLAIVFLGHNRLHTLDQLDKLAPALTVLDVRCNQLEVVPSTIASLVHLKSLDVSNNNLAELPNELGRLASLNHVLLDGNPLRSIRRSVIAGGCVALKNYLAARDSQSSQSPMEAATVSIDGAGIPDYLLRDGCASGVLDLTNRRMLDISQVAMAPRLGATLVHLNVSQNGLKELPANLNNLHLLQSLTAEDNYLTHVPVDVAELTRLRSLRLQKNRLTDSAIRTIIESTAPIRYTLVELDLRHNNLTAVPPGLSAFQALDTLLLSFNKITTLDGVQWTNMTKLTTLLVSNNLLASLGSVHEAPSLTSFNVENNDLSHIPSALGRAPHLNLLNIQGNPQRQIRSTLVLRGPQAVVQFLRELETPPISTAASKRTVDNMDGLADVKSPPKKKSFQPVGATVVPQTPARPVRLESLNQQIRAAEEELDGFGVSNARAAALKKELANLRAQQQRMASDPS
ncbi:hypothetical protein, variant 1 [Aphanomyces invadans]|uniref:Leucine-rich repeat-containing protein 40 n=1 Tax=Aphanomyces invadans TaxID=157072 RepID=A0A024TTF6_9STRA|nr:hypothetical protein, variant 1 [Aphanomyces invadans]ETV96612.1 hypothetical protein, variant 1 [Aphanomyces invadans]|eukprot:XP_008874876.1 hypothetical protein, variant 1 [Aphanomyces invadans]